MDMKKSPLIALVLLTALYLLISLPGWQALTTTTLRSTIDWSLVLHPVLIAQIGWFVIAHLLIFVAIVMLCLTTARAIAHYRPHWYLPITLMVFFLFMYAIIGYSVTHFPWLEISIFSDSFSDQSPYPAIGRNAFYILTLLVVITLFINIRTRKSSAVLQLAAVVFLTIPLWEKQPVYIQQAQADQTPVMRSEPDIILIGMDSVSLYQAREHADRMPFVNNLLQSGHTYTQAFTPLGRTYAAWHSILSGRYPATSGVRFNLTEFKPDQIANMLPADLKELGYFNLYAQDERRFNNINKDYGFDATVGPAVGAADFVIPLFADHPLSSYFLNSGAGEYLFPNLHNNRVSSITYNPVSFTRSILEKTAAVDPAQPLFMAGHFCLAHFPYRWRNYNTTTNIRDEMALYRESLQALDQQIADLMAGLEKQGRLQNAIVILLSDHGEGLGRTVALWNGDDQTPAKQFGQILRGHGNSLLSRDQSNVIINIRHTAAEATAESISTPVSLVDIRPTLLRLLNQPVPASVDGQAIPPAATEAAANRYLFMETGIMMDLPNPGATAEELADKVKSMAGGYIVNADGRLIISDEFIRTNLDKKQFGVIYNDEMLISDSNNPDAFLWINRAEPSWQPFSGHELSTDQRRHLLHALNCYRQPESHCNPSAN